MDNKIKVYETDPKQEKGGIVIISVTLKTFTVAMVALLALCMAVPSALAADKPNILIIWGDDVGYWNLSHINRGMMGYQTPNIDSVGKVAGDLQGVPAAGRHHAGHRRRHQAA